MKVGKVNKKLGFLIYMLIDTFLIAIGMGIPILCIMMGFPVGWYIVKRLSKSKRTIENFMGSIIKYSTISALFTFSWMVIIWIPISAMLINPYADYSNFGIPMILYDPKISFIGWIILMVFISPFLQLLCTVFTAQLTLWRSIKNQRKVNINDVRNCPEDTFHL